MVQSVPHLVLNTIAIYLGIEMSITLEELEPEWEITTVIYSDYKAEEGITIPAPTMILDGTRLHWGKLSEDVLEHSFRLEA